MVEVAKVKVEWWRSGLSGGESRRSRVSKNEVGLKRMN